MTKVNVRKKVEEDWCWIISRLHLDARQRSFLDQYVAMALAGNKTAGVIVLALRKKWAKEQSVEDK